MYMGEAIFNSKFLRMGCYAWLACGAASILLAIAHPMTIVLAAEMF
jgi:heme exporter protein D